METGFLEFFERQNLFFEEAATGFQALMMYRKKIERPLVLLRPPLPPEWGEGINADPSCPRPTSWVRTRVRRLALPCKSISSQFPFPSPRGEPTYMISTTSSETQILGRLEPGDLVLCGRVPRHSSGRPDRVPKVSRESKSGRQRSS
jgi:hypothetical protein